MLVVDAQQILSLVRMPELIEALRVAFGSGAAAPLRQVAAVPGGRGDRLFLSMPAFAADGSGVAKLVTVFPDNAARGMPTVHASVVVFSVTGVPVALLDGTSLTRLRTAAASALASSYLSRGDSSRLVIVGTGSLAPFMAAAHCCVRPIHTVEVWGRREAKAHETARAIRTLVGRDVDVVVSTSLQRSLRDAHIVSCATNSSTPIVRGDWVHSGTFVDLVGAYSRDMRESDDALVQRARIFVDTFEGAMAEAGDILDPLARGVIAREKVEAELKDLVARTHPGRQSPDDLILFKSVGAAIEDLTAARLVIAALSEAH